MVSPISFTSLKIGGQKSMVIIIQKLSNIYYMWLFNFALTFHVVKNNFFHVLFWISNRRSDKRIFLVNTFFLNHNIHSNIHEYSLFKTINFKLIISMISCIKFFSFLSFRSFQVRCLSVLDPKGRFSLY